MRSRASILLASVLGMLCASAAYAAPAVPKLSIGLDAAKSPQDVSMSLQILIVLTILSIAPGLLIMLTSFTRIIIVLSFTRNALGTQAVPPNTVLIGLALFLTFFTMAPVWTKINDEAVQPYLQKSITMEVAMQKTAGPVRDFMFRQVRDKDIALFVELSKIKRPSTEADVPTYVLVPAFLISELKTAFSIGFLIFVPFLIIDMVVSVILMSMGMMMLPPVMISLPFKILLFVLVDGWHLIAQSLALSFH